MKAYILIFAALLLMFAPSSSSDTSSLKIAAFNVQVFGLSKLSKQVVLKNLIKIIRRYDIILFQEIRDSSQTAIFDLVNAVNKGIDEKYNIAVSSRLGRSTSKEQYAYIYRKVQLIQAYVYADKSDVFEREPYVALFNWRSTNFFMIGIHTAPGAAETEISHLVDVYDDAKSKFGSDDAILVGDFNAGCSYVTNSEWPTIKLATDSRFYWLIDDADDTTTKSTTCAYDRFVVAGSVMLKMVLPGSAKPFDYAKAYGLDSATAVLVSDHYPIEMELVPLKSNSKFKDRKTMSTYHPLSGQLSKYKIYSLRRDAEKHPAYSVKTYYTSSGAIDIFSVGVKATGIVHLHSTLNQMVIDFGQFISTSQRDTIYSRAAELSTYYMLPNGNGRYQTLRDYYKSLTSHYYLLLRCIVTEQSCYAQVQLVES